MKKKLMLDLDDVICGGGFLYLINKFLGTSYEESYFKEFYMQDIIPDKEAFGEFLLQQNFYNYCELKPRALEVIEKLNNKYDLYICTSYIVKEVIDKSGLFVLQKYEYLKKNLPFISPYKYIFASDKNILNFDIKIDDRIENLGGNATKYLFSAFHNLEMTDNELALKNIVRVTGWDDIENILLD